MVDSEDDGQAGQAHTPPSPSRRRRLGSEFGGVALQELLKNESLLSREDAVLDPIEGERWLLESGSADLIVFIRATYKWRPMLAYGKEFPQEDFS